MDRETLINEVQCSNFKIVKFNFHLDKNIIDKINDVQCNVQIYEFVKFMIAKYHMDEQN